MAGSYNHVVTKSGKLRTGQSFVNMINNLGDAWEAIEEMYGMIWFLANGNPGNVEEARQNYRRGIEEVSPGIQKDN